VLAEEKGEAIVLESNGTPHWVGDAVMLRQAVRNLVDNAIKYSPRGGTITMRAIDRVVDAVIEVTDTGPGIPPELESRIFDRFYRVDGSRSRENGGSGLGLSIARWAVESTGGRLTLESDQGRGSTFRITLPLETPTPVPTPDTETVR
jgi:two-component system phosphate regulon sensor histidine kinase PhoR